MFSNKDLRNLIFPLFVEQFLLIFLFTALSSGGAVIISQYIGCQKKKTASETDFAPQEM